MVELKIVIVNRGEINAQVSEQKLSIMLLKTTSDMFCVMDLIKNSALLKRRRLCYDHRV